MDTSICQQIKQNFMLIKPVSEEALKLFKESFIKIVEFMNEKLELESKGLVEKSSVEDKFFRKEVLNLFGSMLLGTYEFNLYESLAEEVLWFISVLSNRGYKKEFIHNMIRSWNMGVHSFVRPKEAHELTIPLEIMYRHVPLLYDNVNPSEEPLPENSNHFLDLLLKKKKDEAAEYLIQIQREGTTLEMILNKVLPAVMERIGILWETNILSVVDQHVATDICCYAIFRLTEAARQSSNVPCKALVACAPGETHEMAAEIMESYLHLKGWSIDPMGHIAMQNDIINAIKTRKPDVVFLSVSMVARLPAAKALMIEIKKVMPDVKIIMGGRASVLAEKKLAGFCDATVQNYEEGHLQALKQLGCHA